MKLRHQLVTLSLGLSLLLILILGCLLALFMRHLLENNLKEKGSDLALSLIHILSAGRAQPGPAGAGGLAGRAGGWQVREGPGGSRSALARQQQSDGSRPQRLAGRRGADPLSGLQLRPGMFMVSPSESRDIFHEEP